jgi:hypothetical protein
MIVHYYAPGERFEATELGVIKSFTSLEGQPE